MPLVMMKNARLDASSPIAKVRIPTIFPVIDKGLSAHSGQELEVSVLAIAN